MKKTLLIALGTAALAFGTNAKGDVTLRSDLKIPPYYKPGGGTCNPGRGYTFGPEAPNYPLTYPRLNLRVFNGEVIGFTFEVPAKEGWKPWYDQPDGKPTEHDGSIPHYTQTIFFKAGPTVEECKASKGPYG